MTKMPTFEGNLSFLDPVTNSDPFAAYAHLLQEQPIYFDPAVNIYIVTRYDDIRRFLMDPNTFSSASWKDIVRYQWEDEQSRVLKERFTLQGGFVPPPNVASMDDPRHREVRAIFEKAFRPSRVKEMEANIQRTAASLIDACAGMGSCEFVSAFSIPFPMTVIFSEVGARVEDIWLIKAWMNSIIDRSSFCQTPEQQFKSIDDNAAAQKYFKTIVDTLKGSGNGTVLSELINTPLSDGQFLTEAELITNIIDILFLAGTETTTNTISAGVRILCEQPALFQSLKAGPEKVRVFVEETLRLESPAQGIFRVVTEDVELHGVTLPKGSVLHLRVGAANRDESKFACPAHMELDRKNASVHLAFGAGIHHCVGSVLARRELYWAFTTLVDRFNNIRLNPAKGPITYLQNYMFRSINELHVHFDAA
jgi:cytochrome P450